MIPDSQDRARAAWKTALAPTAACIPIERLAEPLSDSDSSHLATCPRCQTELALWQEFNEPGPRPEQGAAAAWIAQELQRRSAAGSARQTRWWQRWMPVPAYRLSGALAAMLLLVGITVYMTRNHVGLPARTADEGSFRSQSVVLSSPVGDLDAAPVELRWQPVPEAATYEVEILEVDRHSLWKGETQQTRMAIPAAVRAVISPGKTLLWIVTARNSSRVALATSGVQKFRVRIKKNIGGEL